MKIKRESMGVVQCLFRQREDKRRCEVGGRQSVCSSEVLDMKLLSRSTQTEVGKLCLEISR